MNVKQLKKALENIGDEVEISLLNDDGYEDDIAIVLCTIANEPSIFIEPCCEALDYGKHSWRTGDIDNSDQDMELAYLHVDEGWWNDGTNKNNKA